MKKEKTYKQRVRGAWLYFLMLSVIWILITVLVWALKIGNNFTLPIEAVVLIVYGYLGKKMLIVPESRSIPVLNYHSITPHPEWMIIGNHISMSPVIFNRQLKYLQRRKYTTITVSELVKNWKEIHRNKNKKLYVAITFDDGYADNWKYAFPLLQGYEMKATIFVSKDFISDQKELFKEVNSKSTKGYLTWEQIRIMHASDLIDIQAHGATHTRVFSSDQLIDFHNPGYQNVWLFWNNKPEHKLNWWVHDLSSFAPRGYPLYPQVPSLCTRQFIPENSIVDTMQKKVAEKEAQNNEFWKKPWKKELLKIYEEQVNAHGKAGCFESDDDYRKRVQEELNSIKNTIYKHLNIFPKILCWPENCFTEESIKLAKECGFDVSVSNYHFGRNCIEDECTRISRIFVGSNFFGVKNDYLDFFGFWSTLKCYEGFYILYPFLILGTIMRKLMGMQKSLGPFTPLKVSK